MATPSAKCTNHAQPRPDGYGWRFCVYGFSMIKRKPALWSLCVSARMTLVSAPKLSGTALTSSPHAQRTMGCGETVLVRSMIVFAPQFLQVISIKRSSEKSKAICLVIRAFYTPFSSRTPSRTALASTVPAHR
jgi:hypothetical protein